MKAIKNFNHEAQNLTTPERSDVPTRITKEQSNNRFAAVRDGSWLIIFFILLVIPVFACEIEGHFWFNVSNSEEEILYSGCYDAINLGPHIIEYILTKERAEAGGIRPNARFTQDRDGGVLQALLLEHHYSLPHHNDFTRSGFDRGHMAPNADFNDTYENALMTFFIANIWPQSPRLNRVDWLRTENQTRSLASEYEFIKVVIVVDEFSEERVGNITVPLNFKRYVYDLYSGNLIYEIVVYQFNVPAETE